MIQGKLFAVVHNSTSVCVDGFGCWIAAVHGPDGKFIVRTDCVEESASRLGAIRAARELLQAHACPEGKVYVRRENGSLQEVP